VVAAAASARSRSRPQALARRSWSRATRAQWREQVVGGCQQRQQVRQSVRRQFPQFSQQQRGITTAQGIICPQPVACQVAQFIVQVRVVVPGRGLQASQALGRQIGSGLQILPPPGYALAGLRGRYRCQRFSSATISTRQIWPFNHLA
jgi:hypothetical protein